MKIAAACILPHRCTQHPASCVLRQKPDDEPDAEDPRAQVLRDRVERLVDVTLLFRTSTVFALNTLNASTMPRIVDRVHLERCAPRAGRCSTGSA